MNLCVAAMSSWCDTDGRTEVNLIESPHVLTIARQQRFVCLLSGVPECSGASSAKAKVWQHDCVHANDVRVHEDSSPVAISSVDSIIYFTTTTACHT